MKKLLTLIVAIIFSLTPPAKAQLNVNINGATQAPIPVAFPSIISDSNGIGAFLGFSYANKVRDVVLADLERSGLFRIINERSYIQKFKSLDEDPIFEQVLVKVFSVGKPGKIEKEFDNVLFDLTYAFQNGFEDEEIDFNEEENDG